MWSDCAKGWCENKRLFFALKREINFLDVITCFTHSTGLCSLSTGLCICTGHYYMPLHWFVNTFFKSWLWISCTVWSHCERAFTEIVTIHIFVVDLFMYYLKSLLESSEPQLYCCVTSFSRWVWDRSQILCYHLVTLKCANKISNACPWSKDCNITYLKIY